MSEPDLRKLLGHTKDQRQLILFAVACCRNIWHLLTDQRSKDAVEVAEQFADGLVSKEELNAARDAAYDAAWAAACYASNAASGAANSALAAANAAANAAAWDAWDAWDVVRDAAIEQQLVLLNDIIYQPSITLNPNLLSWNNSLLPKFATNIYTNKDFTLMPILADALEDANAPDTLIEHCRQPLHVKGCWLLDLLKLS